MKKIFLLLALSLFLFGCEKTPQPEPDSKLSFGIPEAFMIFNEYRAFVVIFEDGIADQTVTWSVQPTTGGTISADPDHNNVGIYKAPAIAGTYKVCATLVSDPTQKTCMQITVSDVPINDEAIFDNQNIGGVRTGNPTTLTAFTITAERLITYVHNYHYFNGGILPGTISFKHSDGTVYGPWQTWGIVGQGGVANAYWVCHPVTKIKAGDYTVIDSDPATWSNNSGSDNRGFTLIRAMKLK